MAKKSAAFICVHNSCRSQIAEALARKHLSDICEVYSAGTETKPQINQDAVRLVKARFGIDMEKEQHSKLMSDIPECDIYISMGCNVVCPFVSGKDNRNWGLPDPTGQDDDMFNAIIDRIEQNIFALREELTT